MPINIAKRYAQALFEKGKEDHTLEAFQEDASLIKAAIEQSEDLVLFLNNPVIPPEKRTLVLKEIFEKNISESTMEFILFLERKKRLNLLKTICEELQDFCLEEKGVARAKFISRWPLISAETKFLTNYLQQKLNKEILPQALLDESILGGIKIQVGDIIYDYSLQTQLDKFKKSLILG